MKITAIELYHVSVPLKQTFWPTWIPGYPQTHNTFNLIKLVTDEGIEGYSAGTAMGVEREGLGDLIGGYLLGILEADLLFEYSRSIAQLIQAGQHLKSFSRAHRLAVIDVDVDHHEHHPLGGPSVDVEIRLKLGPTIFFEKFEITGIVNMIMIIRMVVPDFNFNLSFKHSQTPFLVQYLLDLYFN